MSSASSVASSIGSLSSTKSKLSSSDLNDENNDPLESDIDDEDNDFDDDDLNSQFSSYEEDDDDEFELKEEAKTTANISRIDVFSSDDPFELNIKTDQNDSGISLNSTKTSIENQQSPNKSLGLDLNAGFESDDSDSLFSITKSVSIHSIMNTNRPAIISSSDRAKKSLERRKKLKDRKRKKAPSLKHTSYGDEEEEDDDEEAKPHDAAANENECSDDEFKLPTKRAKAEGGGENQLTISMSESAKPPRPRPTTQAEISEYVYEMKRDLLNAIRALGKRLPANTLDELIDLLDGPDHVAEMTGRRGRVVCRNNPATDDLEAKMSSYVYETRNEADVPLELMNVVQKERFMNGEKLVAIISEAASSGISLQANRRYANQFRRVHLTIELPWSADRAIQQFGRTHRSNQVSAPEYIFLISELAGEKRFASTVAKRLESLGALTHGDRRATESRDLSRFNIDNKYGRAALENVIKSICSLEKPMARLPKEYKGNFMRDAREALNGVGMIYYSKSSTTAYPEKDYNNINKFLNRLLGCPVLLQNAIFTFFSDVLAAVILGRYFFVNKFCKRFFFFSEFEPSLEFMFFV